MGHLEEVGMGYLGHMGRAWLNALRLMRASLALFVHGCLPFVFVHTASDLLAGVDLPANKRMKNERQ